MIETDCSIAVPLGIAGVYIAGVYITAFLMGLCLYNDDGLDGDDYFVIFIWPLSLPFILFFVAEDKLKDVSNASRRIPLVGRILRFAKTALRWATIPLRPYALGHMVARFCSWIASKFAAKGTAKERR